jgi:hypothetical protein
MMACLALPGCGSCGGKSQPIIDHAEGGGAFITTDADGGRVVIQARNRRSPIYDLVDGGAAR